VDLTPEIRTQIFERDNRTCLWCGKKANTLRSLSIDHILPISMGGTDAISNLQTLCKYCNQLKGKNHVNYRVNVTPLHQPKEQLIRYAPYRSDTVDNAIARIVNDFYHCKALHELIYHVKSNGQHYSKWKIMLYRGNNPDWLQAYEKELLDYVLKEFGWIHVSKIDVIAG
jgi:hypothetical protein